MDNDNVADAFEEAGQKVCSDQESFLTGATGWDDDGNDVWNDGFKEPLFNIFEKN